MARSGYYRYHVVENPGTEREFRVGTYDRRHMAERVIKELYEPEDFEEMSVSILTSHKGPGRISKHPEIPEGTEIVREIIIKPGRKKPEYRYSAVAGNIVRHFGDKVRAAKWLIRNCQDMPQLTMTTIADIMQRGIETSLGKWLDHIEVVEATSDKSPWYADPSVYANPFAIRLKTTSKPPFVMTRADFADAIAAALVDSNMKGIMEKFVIGKYTNGDAERFLRFIISKMQY